MVEEKTGHQEISRRPMVRTYRSMLERVRHINVPSRHFSIDVVFDLRDNLVDILENPFSEPLRVMGLASALIKFSGCEMDVDWSAVREDVLENHLGAS